MILALRPARGAGQKVGGGSPATTLPLSVKARWQGAPSATLKPVAVSQDWRALLAQPEPLLQVSAGPLLLCDACTCTAATCSFAQRVTQRYVIAVARRALIAHLLSLLRKRMSARMWMLAPCDVYCV